MLFADLCRYPLIWTYRTYPSCRARLSSELGPQQCHNLPVCPGPSLGGLAGLPSPLTSCQLSGLNTCLPAPHRYRYQAWQDELRGLQKIIRDEVETNIQVLGEEGVRTTLCYAPDHCLARLAHTTHSRGPPAHTQDAVTLGSDDENGRHISANLDLCRVATLLGYLTQT